MHASPLVIRAAAAAGIGLVVLAGCGASSPSKAAVGRPPGSANVASLSGARTAARTAAGAALSGRLVGQAASLVTGSTDSTVTATGHGQTEGTPDLLTVTLGVQSSGPRLQPTLDTNNQEAQAVIAKLESDGVLAKDLQTSQLSVNPAYSQPGPNAPPKLTGYQVTDIVTANIHQLTRAGAIIDDAVAAGGNDAQLQSVFYSVEDPAPLEASARAAAVKQAQAEAQAMAAAAGVSLGSVRAVNDLAQPQYQCCSGVGGATSAASSSMGAATTLPPLQAGSAVFTADVSVVYEIS
jgi:uncharacterized protein YggE